jgi:hypothetical protein
LTQRRALARFSRAGVVRSGRAAKRAGGLLIGRMSSGHYLECKNNERGAKYERGYKLKCNWHF